MNKKKSYESLKKKIENLEARVDKLEKVLKSAGSNPGGSSKKRKAKKSKKKSKSNNNKNLDHNYLKKTIDDARKRYEREHNT